MTRLADFLASTAQNADLQMQFFANPEKTMKQAGLTSREIQVLKDADADRIREVAGKSKGNKGFMFAFMWDPSSGAPISKNVH